LLSDRYGVPVGLSDHSGKIFAGLAAAALGAEVLEVHVALSRQMFGPDVTASVTTSELAQLVDGVDQIERMVASPVNKDSVSEKFEDLRRIFTKSIVARDNIPAGTILARHHLTLKKPGTGLAADFLGKLVGCTLTRDVRADEMLSLNDVRS
jgi:N-acetylneuraminate synthase